MDEQLKRKDSKRAKATRIAKRWLKTLQELREYKGFYRRIKDYQGHVVVTYESDDFLVKTADSTEDLLRVLELRHEIFIREWQGRKALHGWDVDHYDFEGDHLLIIDKRVDEVVGTYRLLCSKFTNNFYSDSEFDLRELVATPWVKLEMGRACVHQEYRDGNTIDLLWKGLSSYIRQENVHYLFGCSSVKSMDASEVSGLYRYFRDKEAWVDDFRIRAREKYEFPKFSMEDGSKDLTIPQAREMIPPLLRSYLHAGAKVYGYPALDRDFECTDLLTILDLSRLNKKFQSRYLEGFSIND